MKKFNLFTVTLFIQILCSQASKKNFLTQTQNNSDNLYLIVASIMSSFYCKISTVDILTVSSENNMISDKLDRVLPIISNCTSYRLSSNSIKIRRKKVNNIAILNDISEFIYLINKMSTAIFDYRGYYTIIFLDKHVQLETAFKIAWNNSISNINLITMTSGTWNITTFHPFSNGMCGNTRAVVTDTKNPFPDKVKNMQKCPLKFPKLNYYPGLIMDEIGNETIVSGMDGDIMMKGLIKDFNFSIEVLKMKNEEDRWGKQCLLSFFDFLFHFSKKN